MAIAVSDLRRALGGVVRTDVKAALGADEALQNDERAALPSYVRGAARKLAEGATVSDVVDAAMAKAMRNWARHNQKSGRGASVLSNKELSAISKSNRQLAPLMGRAVEIALRQPAPTAPVVALVNAPAGMSLTQSGDRVTIRCATTVPDGTYAVTVDGLEVPFHKYPLSVSFMESVAPEGYALEMLDVGPPANGEIVQALRFVKDAPGTLSTDEAAAAARQGLIDYLKNERIHDRDWQDYFPKTWPELEAAGVPAKIDAMLALRDGEHLGRAPDKYLFVGRGPYDLYTEVEVSKATGLVTRAYVEID